MNGLSSCDDAIERLVVVLNGVLTTGSSGLPDREAHRQARRGATVILPAVQALHRIQRRLRDYRGEAAWEGLVHRHCRMSVSPTGGGVVPGPAVADGISIRQVERAGWELIQVTVGVPVEGRYWRVTHELVRRTSLPRSDAVEDETLTAPGTGFDTPAGCVFYRLTDSDVVSWAQASGDRNLIHLLPGRTAEAGLSVGSDEVVVHGLLLGTTSLALVQSSLSRQVGLAFIGSADIPASKCGAKKSWAMLAVDPINRDITQGRRPVPRRQWFHPSRQRHPEMVRNPGCLPIGIWRNSDRLLEGILTEIHYRLEGSDTRSWE